MGCAIATMKRRRKQFAKKNRHVAKLGRPGTPKMYSKEASSKRLTRLLANERARAGRKASSKK